MRNSDFQKFMESWYELQGISDEPDDDGTILEYLLNFLGLTGTWKHEHCTQTGDDDACATQKKST